jgi:predicted O-linked N-acetylglucosamine transferase (SPINDLY family)
MISNSTPTDLQLQGATALAEGHYAAAAATYEQAIADNPTEVENYWYLGLALLLQGQEAEAQFAWMTPLMENPEQSDLWVSDLVQVLQTESERQTENSAYELAWLLRQHMREFMPNDAENLLKLLELGLKAQTADLEDGLLEQAIEVLNLSSLSDRSVPLETLLSVAQTLLSFDAQNPKIYEFLAACVPYFTEQQRLPDLINTLMVQAWQRHKSSDYPAAIRIGKFCLNLSPEDTHLLEKTVYFLQSGDTASMRESLPLAKQLLQNTSSLTEEITCTQSILTSLMMTCGSLQETHEYYQRYKNLLRSVSHISADSDVLEPVEEIYKVMAMGMFFNYFEDNPTVNRPIRNQLAAVCQANLQLLLADRVNHYQQHRTRRAATQRLKIGYLSDCLRLHSVGWLARGLLTHHDRDRFDVHLYSTRQSNDPLQQSFIQSYGDRFHQVPLPISEIADRINQDGIDILVDLDSLTVFGNCAVTALKPAPVQITWLGYDASGLPAIDYYIADPYVLPEAAQAYYPEKIWRLPQTYIAVDGFEIGTPSVRRDQLGIPTDAIVYLSSQTGLKRNPDNIRLQLKILKEVSNSYFLIKSFYADRQLLSDFFYQLADEVGVERDRLCFLPDVRTSETHRANLGLADVVLDTYPYNGATTTMEALWMELPIVTRVGEQFAARNSYTMMVNVGISEGIAWSDDEYLEWGIRLGEDSALRSSIAYRLRHSRQTAPLWNAAAFAKDMERAYTQMWEQSQG